MEFRGKGRALATLALSEPTTLSGVRIVHAGGSEAQLDELTLLREGRPFVWLWDDSLRVGRR